MKIFTWFKNYITDYKEYSKTFWGMMFFLYAGKTLFAINSPLFSWYNLFLLIVLMILYGIAQALTGLDKKVSAEIKIGKERRLARKKKELLEGYPIAEGEAGEFD